MQVFLVEETRKVSFFKRLLKPIEIKEDKILLNCKCKNMKFKKKNKIIKKIRKKIGNIPVNKIILSKDLKQDIELENLLYSNGFDIISGRQLLKYLIFEMIETTCEKNKIKSEESQISITVNQVNHLTIHLIEKLSKKFKMLNIVTNHIHYFKKLQEKLWEENGIVITVTNNKKKALAKANIILNLDFPEELINQYVIYDTSILINVEEKVKIKKKRFCGIIINEYKIKLKEGSNIALCLQKKDYANFDLEDLAEIYIMHNPKEIKDIIIEK